jgi:hypothetical protein
LVLERVKEDIVTFHTLSFRRHIPWHQVEIARLGSQDGMNCGDVAKALLLDDETVCTVDGLVSFSYDGG